MLFLCLRYPIHLKEKDAYFNMVTHRNLNWKGKIGMEEKHHCPPKKHVHEILGSTQIAGCCDSAHNHRFSTVSGDPIPCEGGHVHEVKFSTDSCDGHTHEFCGKTSKPIEVGCGRHVHFIEAHTSNEDRHSHHFVVASMIENPSCEK